jgi:hypothetical protein
MTQENGNRERREAKKSRKIIQNSQPWIHESTAFFIGGVGLAMVITDTFSTVGKGFLVLGILGYYNSHGFI